MKYPLLDNLQSPWIVFFLLTGGLTFIGLASLCPAVKGLLFVVLLCLFCLSVLKKEMAGGWPKTPNFQKERAPLFSTWVLTAVVPAALFLRFFKLTSFRPWPSADEALQGYFAIDLIHQWSWRFFYTSGQHPPLLIWMLKWFFQFIKSPFFDIWFLSAFLSLIFVFFGYAAARFFFPKNLSVIFGTLLATAFWPIYFGRFCVQGIWIPAFEVAVFLSLGYFLKAKSDRAQTFWVSMIGLLTGLGTWTFTSWITVVVYISGVIFFGTERTTQNRKLKGFFALFLFLGASPWLAAAFEEKFGGYVVGVSLLGGFFSWKQQALTSLSYLTNLFWGTLREPVSYGPLVGGMLNPVLGACFFLGAGEFYHCRNTGLAKAVGLAFIVFLLPGVLSADHVEMFRIIQLMPLVLLITAVGIQTLFNSFSGKKKVFFLFLFFLSALFDVYHLSKATPDGFSFFSTDGPKQLQVQDENYWAYKSLEPIAQKLGPGLIFTDFILLTHNHTLSVACYPFNALDNESLEPAKARWAAIVSNIHYMPFFLKRFPGSQWHPITPSPTEDGGSAICIIPINPRNQSVFTRWIQVDRYFHRLGVEAENMMNNPVEYQQAVTRLPLGYALLNGDPFLESCYGEWVAQYHQAKGFNWNIRAVQRGIQKGYPTANLYYKLGGFYFWNGEMEKAKQSYLMASKCKPNYTNAGQVLSKIWGVTP